MGCAVVKAKIYVHRPWHTAKTLHQVLRSSSRTPATTLILIKLIVFAKPYLKGALFSIIDV